MNRHRLTVPHHDPALLTESERAELLDLQSRVALDPYGPWLGRFNVLLGKATATAWVATITPTRANNYRPAAAPAPVNDDRRDRVKASKRDRYDDVDDEIHARHRPHFWGRR